MDAFLAKPMTLNTFQNTVLTLRLNTTNNNNNKK